MLSGKVRPDFSRTRTLGIDQVPDAVILTDRAGTILEINRAAEHLFGYEQAELAGKSVEILIPERYRPSHGRHVEHFRASPLSRAMGAASGIVGRRKEGVEVPVDIMLSPIVDGEGTEKILAVVRDVTRVKSLTDELEHFVRAASHDLQEPLRRISVYCDFLEEGLSDEQSDAVKQDLTAIKDSAGRMRGLVKDLLNYARINAEPVTLRPVDPNECIALAWESIAPSERKKKLEGITGDAPRVLADEVLLSQVYQNLISNAQKFSAKDRPLTLNFSAERLGSNIVLSVADNGIGIETKDLARIFEPMTRLHSRDKYDGTGVGLSICKKAIERLGGRIWAESDVGVGSTFKIALKAA